MNTDKLEMLTPKQVQKKLSIPQSTLYRWMAEGKFPTPIKVGERKTLFRVSDLEEWLDKKESKNAFDHYHSES